MRGKSWTGLLLVVIITMAIAASGCGKQPAGSGKAAGPAGFKPEKSVTMVVPFAAGGSSDLLARAIEKVWSKYCPQPVQIVNKLGGGGLEGSTFVARAKPDGYTILLGYGSGHDLVMPHLEKIEYDPFRDLVPVCRLSMHTVLVLVPENSPHKSIQDIVDWAKRENKPVTAAVSTTAGAVDLVMRGIGKTSGIVVTPIPHAGSSQAVTTLLGGQTTMGGGFACEIIPALKANRLRPLASATYERDPAMPNVPTLREQGINVYNWGSVKGIAVPNNTPKEVVDYYAELFKKITEDPDFRKAMQDMLQPVQYMGPEEYAKFMRQAYDDHGRMIKELGLGRKE